MKAMWVFSFLAIAALGAVAGASQISASKPTPTKQDLPGFAFVELFTSEGCSSCPSADSALYRFRKDAKASGKNVFVLAYHVDYWDYIGHVDRFGSKAFSERQRQYNKVMNRSGVYTPQAVVNGYTEFVGSSAKQLQSETENAMTWKPRVALDVQVSRGEPHEVKIRYTANGLRAGDVLQFAVVEDGLKTDVKRGENAGKILYHDHVVRALLSIEPNGNKSGTALIVAPQNAQLANSSVIVFVQESRTLRIVGATEVKI